MLDSGSLLPIADLSAVALAKAECRPPALPPAHEPMRAPVRVEDEDDDDDEDGCDWGQASAGPWGLSPLAQRGLQGRACSR